MIFIHVDLACDTTPDFELHRHHLGVKDQSHVLLRKTPPADLLNIDINPKMSETSLLYVVIFYMIS